MERMLDINREVGGRGERKQVRKITKIQRQCLDKEERKRKRRTINMKAE